MGIISKQIAHILVLNITPDIIIKHLLDKHIPLLSIAKQATLMQIMQVTLQKILFLNNKAHYSVFHPTNFMH